MGGEGARKGGRRDGSLRAPKVLLLTEMGWQRGGGKGALCAAAKVQGRRAALEKSGPIRWHCCDKRCSAQPRRAGGAPTGGIPGGWRRPLQCHGWGGSRGDGAAGLRGGGAQLVGGGGGGGRGNRGGGGHGAPLGGSATCTVPSAPFMALSADNGWHFGPRSTGGAHPLRHPDLPPTPPPTPPPPTPIPSPPLPRHRGARQCRPPAGSAPQHLY